MRSEAKKLSRRKRTSLPAEGTDEKSFYIERQPNVRFHLPYDLTREHRRQFAAFAKNRGEGKISAHGPHRDSWLDCPDNAINVWAAIGPVAEGNGLSLFPSVYRSRLQYVPGRGVPRNQLLGPALAVVLEPGDVLLFHSQHVHASELNRTPWTRHVVSFRVCAERPHFPNGHYHHYGHTGLSWAPQLVRELPAVASLSFFETKLLRLSQVGPVGRSSLQVGGSYAGGDRAAP